MRTRAMGQDVPYGAAPSKVLDLVAFDLPIAFFFGYFLLARCQKKVTRPLADETLLIVACRHSTQR